MSITTILHVLSALFIAGGAFFLMVGSLGLIRFPDFYTRNHATGKADTLGVMLVIFGLIILEGFSVNSAKLLIMLGFIALTNPVGTNVMARAAFHFKQVPWFKEEGSKSQELLEEEK